jgi:hypothetical protein
MFQNVLQGFLKEFADKSGNLRADKGGDKSEVAERICAMRASY